MKKKETIKKLKKQVSRLNKIVTESSVTLTNPDNKNIKVTIQIKDGCFTIDEIVYPVLLPIPEPIISNINQKEL